MMMYHKENKARCCNEEWLEIRAIADAPQLGGEPHLKKVTVDLCYLILCFFACLFLIFIQAYLIYLVFWSSFSEALSSYILLKTQSIRFLIGNGPCMKCYLRYILSEFSGCPLSFGLQCLPTGKVLWLALSLPHWLLTYYWIPQKGQSGALQGVGPRLGTWVARVSSNTDKCWEFCGSGPFLPGQGSSFQIPVHCLHRSRSPIPLS